MFYAWQARYFPIILNPPFYFPALCAAETVNSLPGKGEVCTATSAMIALHCASQQLVSDSFGPVVACYQAFAKICHSPTLVGCQQGQRRREPGSVDNLRHRIGLDGDKCTAFTEANH